MKGINWAFFMVLIVLPLAGGMIYSFLYSIGAIGLLREGISLKHWERVWMEGIFLKTLGYSFYIAGTTLLLSLSIALFLVFSLMKSTRKNPYWMYMPLALPAMVVGFLSFQWWGRSGFFSRMAYQMGLISDLTDFPVLIQDPWGFGIIFSHTLMAIPFFWIFFRGLYENERVEELSQIACSLGANQGQILRRVSIPLLLKQGFPTLLLYFLFVLGSYEIPLLLGQSSPQMVSVSIIRKMERFNLLDKPEAYTMMWMYALLVLLLVGWALNRNLKSSEQG